MFRVIPGPRVRQPRELRGNGQFPLCAPGSVNTVSMAWRGERAAWRGANSKSKASRSGPKNLSHIAPSAEGQNLLATS
ncbi:MAG: hypothetical protein JWM33_3691 [Caulobacteraceae bacterium]|nr:hypothetical protein [Caulobacteraceae bacterium]